MMNFCIDDRSWQRNACFGIDSLLRRIFIHLSSIRQDYA